MPTTSKTAIVDTSCFILLDKIGELELLRSVFANVVTTTTVVKEFGSPLPKWVQIKSVRDIHFSSTLDLGPGEASVISLAMEFGPSLIILDDNKGRKVARRLNLNITGSLGLFLKAKRDGLIPSVRSVLEKIQKTNFRYSPSVLEEILTLANE